MNNLCFDFLNHDFSSIIVSFLNLFEKLNLRLISRKSNHIILYKFLIEKEYEYILYKVSLNPNFVHNDIIFLRWLTKKEVINKLLLTKDTFVGSYVNFYMDVKQLTLSNVNNYKTNLFTKLHNLQSLILYEDSLKNIGSIDLKFLESLIYLKELYIHIPHIHNLSYIIKLINLEKLTINASVSGSIEGVLEHLPKNKLNYLYLNIRNVFELDKIIDKIICFDKLTCLKLWNRTNTNKLHLLNKLEKLEILEIVCYNEDTIFKLIPNKIKKLKVIIHDIFWKTVSLEGCEHFERLESFSLKSLSNSTIICDIELLYFVNNLKTLIIAGIDYDYDKIISNTICHLKLNCIKGYEFSKNIHINFPNCKSYKLDSTCQSILRCINKDTIIYWNHTKDDVYYDIDKCKLLSIFKTIFVPYNSKFLLKLDQLHYIKNFKMQNFKINYNHKDKYYYDIII